MGSKALIDIVDFVNNGTSYDLPCDIESNANAMVFINGGTAIVTIQPILVVLNPGQQFVTAGNIGERDTTRYSWSASATGSKYLIVISKTYV